MASLGTSEVNRETKETRISAALNLDGERKVNVKTGIGFLDHMITAFAFHAGWNLTLVCDGDLEVDDHHSAEDAALVLGDLLKQCVGDRSGIVRFGSAYAPLDEALARTVVDFSGRPGAYVSLDLKREMIGSLASENMTHFWQSLAIASGITLHIDVIRGENDHHKAEAAAKSAALAFRAALSKPETSETLSTKGVL